MPFAEEELVETEIELPAGPLRLRRPAEWADLPDDGGVEWAPIAPYWAVLWRSGVVLARAVEGMDLGGKRVIELGCGLGLPSLAAARAGADVLATDEDAEALELLELNARAAGLEVGRSRFDFTCEPPPARFDLAIASDVLYEEASVQPLLELLPSLADEAVICSPERKPFARFAAEAELLWPARRGREGVIEKLRLAF